MDKGDTTADQDKRFIRAMNKVAYELDRSIRGEKKAKKTYDSSKRLAEGGIEPETPMDLDSNVKDVEKKSSTEILEDVENVTCEIKNAVDLKVKEDECAEQ